MSIDPGKLPLGPILEEAHRRERESEARAERYAQLHPNDGAGTSARGVRRVLHRLRLAITRHR
jgi:hypothetical protein